MNVPIGPPGDGSSGNNGANTVFLAAGLGAAAFVFRNDVRRIAANQGPKLVRAGRRAIGAVGRFVRGLL
ncbi:MAG: hypothetical protein U5J98_06900 [Halobacteriales archaeon]|nr:hypothetical protein [Halobacteriales archaeon]